MRRHNSSNHKSFPWKADEKKEGLEWSFNPTTIKERAKYPTCGRDLGDTEDAAAREDHLLQSQ